MSDIRCHCPHCEQVIAAPETAAGQVVACPNCSQEFALPEFEDAAAAQPEAAAGEDSEFVMIRCNACRTELEVTTDMLGEVSPCPACGREIVITAATDEEPEAPPAASTSGKKKVILKKKGGTTIRKRAPVTRHPKGADTPDAASDGPDHPPPEACGWSWAAFLWGPIWAIGNGVYFGLLELIPVPVLGLVIRIMLAAKGKKKSWEKGKWRDVDHFVKSQRRWVKAWLTILPIMLLIQGGIVAAVLLQAGKEVQGVIKGAESQLSAPSTIKSTSGRLAVSVPGGWAARDDLNPDADIQVGNGSIRAYLTVITQPKSDFDEGLELDDVAKQKLDEMVEALEDGEAKSAPAPVRVNSMPSSEFSIQGTKGSREWFYLVTVVEGKSSYLTITGWTPPAKQEENLSVLRKVSRSLKPATR